MKRNYIYWTAERDEELKRHEAAGLSARQIAVLLSTTRSAVIGRSNRLRGKLFKSDAERLERSAKRTKRHAHQGNCFAAKGADLAAVQADLAAGIDRDVVIKRALSAGIGRAAVGKLFGLSIAQVYQIAGPARRSPKRQTNK
jgi:hypothetical protein